MSCRCLGARIVFKDRIHKTLLTYFVPVIQHFPLSFAEPKNGKGTA
jgi:hypothetical protein